LRPAARHRGTIVLGAAAALGLAGTVYCGILYVRYERLAAAEQAAARRAETANADLQDAVARLRDQLGSASQGLNTAQRRVTELSEEARRQLAASEQVATSKTDRIAQLNRALEQVQRDLHLAEAQRVTLMARLSKSTVDVADGHARQQQQIQASHDQWQKKLVQLSADRDKAATERDRMRARVGELEQKLSLLQTRQAPRPVAEARPEPAPRPAASAAPAAAAPAVAAPVAAAPAVAAPSAPVAATPVVAAALPAASPPPDTVQPAARPAPVGPSLGAVTAIPRGGIAQFERVLASSGVDVKHLFSQYGMSRGEGGPFIPAPRGAEPAALSPDKIAALSRLVKSLPIAAPLEGYEIGSRFGVRGDPINGRASLHTGTDFRAPYGSPVYATASGVVTYSGYRADYGRIVEIDHGNGLTTRYGHMHRAAVSVGQRVAAHGQIGWLGSSGRSTGPHVHYEILVNGEPQDPEKFLGLARIMPVLARR
jgi:murein DD-endopeptidase MepM/ murein hydrolase activator NlpD